jgi:hypothetical protein
MCVRGGPNVRGARARPLRFIGHARAARGGNLTRWRCRALRWPARGLIRTGGVAVKRGSLATSIDCPLLYLDATARLSVAERRRGPITRLADVQAAAPHMRVIQVHDRAFGYVRRLRVPVLVPAPGKAALANRVVSLK